MTLKELIDRAKNPLEVHLYNGDEVGVDNYICSCKSDSIALKQFYDWLVVSYVPKFYPYTDTASMDIYIENNVPFK